MVKSFAVFEAQPGWTGTSHVGWYAATWDEVKNLTITNGPFTEFPDTLNGSAGMQDDPLYSAMNWATWADRSAGGNCGWERDGLMITFGQSTGGNPAHTKISNIKINQQPISVITAAIVPEPSTICMLLACAVMAVGVYWRRRRLVKQ